MDNNITSDSTQAMVQTGIRLPEELWKRTRRIALELSQPAQDIVAAALEAHLPKLEKKLVPANGR